MLKAFPIAYAPSRPIDPQKDDPEKIAQVVFGASGAGNTDYSRINSELTLNELFAYKNLFKSRSKPASHYKALSKLTDAEIVQHCPEPLKALVEQAKLILTPSTIVEPEA